MGLRARAPADGHARSRRPGQIGPGAALDPRGIAPARRALVQRASGAGVLARVGDRRGGGPGRSSRHARLQRGRPAPLALAAAAPARALLREVPRAVGRRPRRRVDPDVHDQEPITTLQSIADRDVLGAMTRRRVLPLLVGFVALLLAGTITPHLHAGPESGFWNADHDLVLMATFGTHACQLGVMPALALVLALTATIAFSGVRAASAPLRRSAPRGPPLRSRSSA